MSNVKLLNPEECGKIFQNWGETSSVCYNSTPDDYSALGLGCMFSGHFSGSRGDYIKFLITDVPRLCIDEAVRHSVGTFCNVQSFRYVDKEQFTYAVPNDIVEIPTLLELYDKQMANSMKIYEIIRDTLLNTGASKERATEQARYVLPMATNSAFVMGFTVEALIHFMNVRLCTRADDEIRAMAIKMRDEVVKVLPALKNRLVPSCQDKLYCPEGKKSCGAYPTKKEVKALIGKALTVEEPSTATEEVSVN